MAGGIGGEGFFEEGELGGGEGFGSAVVENDEQRVLIDPRVLRGVAGALGEEAAEESFQMS